MKIEKLQQMFFDNNTQELEFEGTCHDCKKETLVLAIQSPDEIVISGGSVFQPFPTEPDMIFLKCEACTSIDPVLRNYQPTSVYSRVVGYLRPTENWNGAKQAEFAQRKEFTIPENLTVETL